MKYQGRVLSKLLLLGLICQLPAYGQFSKYRSRSKFKPQQVQPLPPHMRGETAPSPEEVEEMNEDIAEEDLSEEDESESEELSDKSYNPGASDSNAKTFVTLFATGSIIWANLSTNSEADLILFSHSLSLA